MTRREEATAEGDVLTRHPAWRPQIEAAGTHEEIITVFRLFGLDAAADRLRCLCSLAYDDPDEACIEIESQLPNGLMQIEWRLPSNGILAMEFLLSGLIRFASISAPAQRGVDGLSVNGTLSVDSTLEVVRPFTVLLQVDDEHAASRRRSRLSILQSLDRRRRVGPWPPPSDQDGVRSICRSTGLSYLCSESAVATIFGVAGPSYVSGEALSRGGLLAASASD